jgi:hypothetical protein
MIELTSGDIGLEDLFAPWSVGTFTAVAWEKAPVVVRGGAMRFAGLTSRAELVRLAARGGAHQVRERRMISVQPEALLEEPAPGALYAVSGLHLGTPLAAALARRLKVALGHPGAVEAVAWLSGPGAVVAGNVFDRRRLLLDVGLSARYRISRCRRAFTCSHTYPGPVNTIWGPANLPSRR